MMKKLLFLFLFLPIAALAQDTFITHTVAAKESLTSIGRQYNINGRELARYNEIDYEKGLTIGQVLKIPVRKDFNTGKTGTYPIYHKVLPKETLYAIHLKYNKVPIDDLKRWNNLIGDALQEGSQIIVGYSDVPAATPVVTSQPVETQKEAPSTQPVVPAQAAATPSLPETTGTFAGGYFKSFFSAGGKKLDGKAGTFKSTSGWDDGKYYCLSNDAPAGTVLKITNKSNGKVIYAKILDVIPDLKRNADLLLSVSNAAAEELEANSPTFDVGVEF